MAATKAVTPLGYSDLVAKYNSEPPWVQGGVVFQQKEIDTVAEIVPQYTPLFVMTEPVAEDITAKCPTFPATDPSVWNPAPAPAY